MHQDFNDPHTTLVPFPQASHSHRYIAVLALSSFFPQYWTGYTKRLRFFFLTEGLAVALILPWYFPRYS